MADKTLVLRKRQRQALRLNSGREIDKAKSLSVPTDADTALVVEAEIGKLTDYRSRLSALNEEILLGIDDDEQAQAEAESAVEFDDAILEASLLLPLN